MKSCKVIAVKILIIFMALLTFNDVKAEALKHEQQIIRAALPMQTGFAEKNSEGNYIIKNLALTESEKEYIKENPVLTVVGYNSGAPYFALFTFAMIFIFYIIRTNAKLKIKNKRYIMLAEISNEYFFEYDVKKDILILSEKSASLIGTERKIKGQGNSLKNHLVDVIRENSFETMKLKEVMKENDKSFEIEIPISDGSTGFFKVINTNIYGNNQKIEYVVGKLVDISEDMAEKKALIRKAQIDGMTGLYNPTSTREKIKNMLAKRQAGTVDAFILLDVDFFKEINDNYGHYTGDQVLQNLSETIRKTFRKTDVAGRFGGDEFCIYMQNIPSEKFVKSRCRQLNEEISNSVDGMNISLSIGISLVDEKKTFDDIYKEADHALYEAKRNGKNQFAVYEDTTKENK